MDWLTSEPGLKEMLSDPVVVAMMKADGVDRRALEAALREVARRLVPTQLPTGHLAASC
jgi:hypothetical protein